MFSFKQLALFLILFLFVLSCTNKEQKKDDEEIISVKAELADLTPPPPIDTNEPPPPPPPPLPSGSSVKTTEFVAEDSSDIEPFIVVDEQPEFSGGMAALINYLVGNTKVPKGCKKKGKVLFEFTVSKSGRLKDVEIKDHPCAYLKNPNELKSLIENMPPWKPGKNDGKAVDTKFQLSVSLRPESED